MSSSAPGDADVVDASGLPFRPVPLSLDGLWVAHQWTVVEWPGSRRHALLGCRLAHDHVDDRAGTRKRPGRDPPRHLRLQLAARSSGQKCLSIPTRAFATDHSVRRLARRREITIGSSASSSVCNRVVNVARRPKQLRSEAESKVCVIATHGGRNSGEPHVRALNILMSDRKGDVYLPRLQKDV
jgi:hypothetical protein